MTPSVPIALLALTAALGCPGCSTESLYAGLRQRECLDSLRRAECEQRLPDYRDYEAERRQATQRRD